MLKIIHLVRDPRATLTSQDFLGECSLKKGGHVGCTDKYCSRLENDLKESEVLTKTYPDRVHTLLYEDMASSPIETTRKLYNFIGTTSTSKVEDYVFNITLAGNPDNCVICTTRSNSSAHIDAWKNKIKQDFLDIIEKRCSHILRHLNYKSKLSVKTEEKIFHIELTIEDPGSY